MVGITNILIEEQRQQTMVEEWKTLDSKILGDFRIFKIRQDTSRSPRTHQDHDFFILESNDWINVIPLTAAGNVVVVYQYRHGTGQVTMEIPGGLVEHDDDSPAEAARRELLEETGYAADPIIPIGTVAPNPAFLNNRCHTFLALNARPVQALQLDGAEDIHVAEVPLSQIPDLISSGRIDHSLVVAAFYHLDRYRQKNGHP